MSNFFKWFFSREVFESQHKNESERLENTMKITSISRYNASVRLKLQGKISFITTTILSLGLIFMPLMQLANIHLIFSSNILSAIQIFLAVAVLVYSVIIGTARYDLRSEQLTECGDKLKALIRDLRIENDDISSIQKRYSDIASSVENHIRNDFLLATLRTNELYHITGVIRFFKWLQYYTTNIIFNIMPIMLLGIELVFILDAFDITSVFTPYLTENK